jgi:hypothetical protein
MKYSVLALAAIVAAGAAGAQSSSPKWVPLDQARQTKSVQAPPPAHAASEPAATPDAAQAKAQGVAQAKAALAARPAARQGIVLWRDVEDGMSVARLHALFPQGQNVVYKNDRTILGNVEIIPGCEAKVNIMHPSGAVSEIVMRGDGSIAGRCSLKLITALSGKYGEPMDKDAVGQSWFGRHGKNYIWAHDGVTLQFKRYTGGILGGDGILAASWELRYSAADTKIDL